jgi:sodium-coupled monocarboxylate transporter 8/12
LAATLPKVDMIMPHYVVNVLPTGVRGLIFAAIFAATMSTVSAALNSFSTVGVVDLYKRLYRPVASDEHYLRVAQVLTLLCGVLITALGLWISLAQTTIVQTIAALGSKFIGPITGMFFLGVFTRRANMPGVFAGAVVGLASGWIIDLPWIAERVNWMWTAPLACLVTFVIGYGVSLMFPNYRSPSEEPAERRAFEVITGPPK